jgi:putative FmdB family regulatory protein
MPFYEYRCERGHTFEVLQRMSDEPVTSCTTCSATVQRVLHPVAVHFKGSGFYTTDYGRRGSGESAGSAAGDSAGGDASKDGAKKDKDGAKKKDGGKKEGTAGSPSKAGSSASD